MTLTTALHVLEAASGAHFETWCGWDIPSRFSDPVTEYRSLRRSAGVMNLSSAGKIRVTGRDRIRFLNNKLTNDIRKLAAGAGCYAALLTRQGTMESDLWVYSSADDLHLECPPCTVERVMATLNKHIVSDRVELEDVTRRFGILSVQGPSAATVVEQATGNSVSALKGLEHRDVDWGTSCRIVNRDRTGSGGYDLWLAAEFLESGWRKLLAAGGSAVGWRALRWARAEAGVPWYGADMNERTLPMEMGMDAAISLNKGCYRGQEIVARVTFRGHLDRRLAGIAVDGEQAPGSREEVFFQEQRIGEVTSAEFSPALGKPLALAVLKISFSQPGTAVKIHSGQGQLSGTVVALPLPEIY
jgi:folate-binding protein YgfZ